MLIAYRVGQEWNDVFFSYVETIRDHGHRVCLISFAVRESSPDPVVHRCELTGMLPRLYNDFLQAFKLSPLGADLHRIPTLVTGYLVEDEFGCVVLHTVWEDIRDFNTTMKEHILSLFPIWIGLRYEIVIYQDIRPEDVPLLEEIGRKLVEGGCQDVDVIYIDMPDQ